MTLVERMMDYRAAENISQTEMAKRVGVSKQTIYHIENGIQKPTRLTVAKIERVIGKENVNAVINK